MRFQTYPPMADEDLRGLADVDRRHGASLLLDRHVAHPPSFAGWGSNARPGLSGKKNSDVKCGDNLQRSELLKGDGHAH